MHSLSPSGRPCEQIQYFVTYTSQYVARYWSGSHTHPPLLEVFLNLLPLGCYAEIAHPYSMYCKMRVINSQN